MRLTTLVFLLTDDLILLALKKQGMGTGKMNGVGGKVEVGETIVKGAVREAYEEIGVIIAPADLEQVAVLTFVFEDKTEWNQECHVFFARKWKGEPIESEEMKPEWVGRAAIPYGRMWADDILWLPRALAGERLAARFNFTKDAVMTDEYSIETITFPQK